MLKNVSAVRLVDLSRPLTPAAEALREAEGVPLATADVQPPELAILDSMEPGGYAVVSQTCDVVRHVSVQPFIQLCPVRSIPADQLRQIQKYESTQFVWLPQLGEDQAADLTRTFTVEKSVLVGQEPIHGVETDEEIRNFAAVVARRFGRFAFPDDLHDSMVRFRSKIVSKHGKGSDEGSALRQIHQIRAEALPNWGAESIEVVLHFILEPTVLPEVETWPKGSPNLPSVSIVEAARNVATSSGTDGVKAWMALAHAWVSLCEPTGVIKSISAQVTTTELFSMEDIRRTEQLDMDYLSVSAGS
ncbi:hypothetical protein [Streptomyces sp. LUP30]|uniref:hypothetical protein n=1 Tax=Streptomyces sp. LUP30 TaxID=1890285 RepID=UPI00114CCDF3|nr:hypothetical protein [Streptomyces sp. LUP30]